MVTKLTDVQCSMIAHYIWLRVETLCQYFFRHRAMTAENGYSKIAKIIQAVQREQYEGETYSERSERFNIHLAVSVISYELWGILNAHKGTLQRLEIINNVRDQKKVTTEEDFQEIAPRIRKYARMELGRQLQKHPALLIILAAPGTQEVTSLR